MTVIESLIISTGLILGLRAAYTDMKSGLVTNKTLVTAILIGLAFNAHFILSGNINVFYFNLKSFGGALGLAFLLYLLGLVPSGDAKLLAVLSLLVPPTSYQLIYPYIHSLTLFINSFVPLAVFLLVKVLLGVKKEETIACLRKSLTPKRMGGLFLRLFSLSGVSSLVLGLLGISDLFIAAGFIVVGLMTIIDQISFDQRLIYAPLLLFTLSLMRHNLLAALYSSLIGFLIYGVFRIFVMDLANDFFTSWVSVDDLEVGMSLADNIVQRENGETYQRRNERLTTIFSPIRSVGKEEGLIKDKNEGLTESEIETIKKLKGKGKLKFDTVKVHQTLPFAPFVYIGYILTISLGRDLLSLFISAL